MRSAVPTGKCPEGHRLGTDELEANRTPTGNSRDVFKVPEDRMI